MHFAGRSCKLSKCACYDLWDINPISNCIEDNREGAGQAIKLSEQMSPVKEALYLAMKLSELGESLYGASPKPVLPFTPLLVPEPHETASNISQAYQTMLAYDKSTWKLEKWFKIPIESKRTNLLKSSTEEKKLRLNRSFPVFG